MFLIHNRRRKNGKTYEYGSLVESVRTSRGPRRRHANGSKKWPKCGAGTWSCRLGPGQDIRLRSVSRPEKHLAILLERLGLPLLNKPKKTQNVVETFATKMRIPSETQTSCLRTAENGFGFAPVQSSTMCLR